MKYTSGDIRMRLKAAVITACRQSLPLDNLEVDAIICVNVTDTKQEHVVKIHQRFGVGEPIIEFDTKPREALINDQANMVHVNEIDVRRVNVQSNMVGRLNIQSNMVNEIDVGRLNEAAHVKDEKLDLTDVLKYKENCVGTEAKNNNSSGRSSSKHPRKSSTPRCLNPKLRQISYENSTDARKEFNLNCENSESIKHDLDSSATSSIFVVDGLNTGSSPVCKFESGTDDITDNKHIGNKASRVSPQPKNENMYIKIEPNIVTDDYLEYGQMLPQDQAGNLQGNENNSNSEKEPSMEINPSNEEYTIELNSDSESIDNTCTYNYTFDKSIDGHSGQKDLKLEKSLDDSDDQSLGSSPSDLTNSMISYNVSHIIPLERINESNGILDIPKYTRSLQGNGGNEQTIKSKAGGKWNEFTSRKSYKVDPNASESLSCSKCGAMFSSTRTRRRHESSTCGATRFSCVVCSKLFSRKDARRRHMLRIHPETESPSQHPYTSISYPIQA